MSASWKNILMAALALAFMVTAVYWDHFDNAFHFDDSHAVQNNAAIKDIALWPTYFTDATTHSSLPTNQGYRPLLTLSFAVDYWLAGNELDPFYFHISTFLWFLLQGVLMFFLFLHILERTRPDGLNPWVALFAVGFYLLHTVNAETINYISARSDVLSTVAVVAGLLIFVKATGWKRHLALLPVALGVLVKPTAVMYLPILGAYIVLFEMRLSIAEAFHPRHWSGLFKWLIPAAVVCLGLFVFTEKMTPETWVPGGSSRFLYAITQPFVILRYFFIFLVPTGLTADSDWKLIERMADWRFKLGLAFLVGLGVIIWQSSRSERGRPVAFGLLWFLFALVPTSSIIPLSEVTNDHRVFFPYVGLVLAVTWPLANGFISRREAHPEQTKMLRNTALLLVGLLLGGHSIGVMARNEVWATGETLWHDVTIKSPKNGRGLMNYGLALMNKGDHAGALRYYKKALNTDYKNHPYLFINMASAQQALGNTAEVEPLYKKALNNGWGFPDCHYFYAQWLWKNNRMSEAEYHTKEALRLSPGHEYAKGLLGYLSARTGGLLEQAKQTVKESPTPENWLNLSLQLYRSNDFKGCIEASEEALKLRPDYADAYNNICSAYNAMGQWKEGIEACERALAIRPDYALARNNLNWAKAEMAK